MPQSDPPEWMTVREVADRFRVSVMTVYRMIDAGTLPSIRFGHTVRIPVDALTKYTTPPDMSMTGRRAEDAPGTPPPVG